MFKRVTIRTQVFQIIGIAVRSISIPVVELDNFRMISISTFRAFFRSIGDFFSGLSSSFSFTLINCGTALRRAVLGATSHILSSFKLAFAFNACGYQSLFQHAEKFATVRTKARSKAFSFYRGRRSLVLTSTIFTGKNDSNPRRWGHLPRLPRMFYSARLRTKGTTNRLVPLLEQFAAKYTLGCIAFTDWLDSHSNRMVFIPPKHPAFEGAVFAVCILGGEI
jgi:hypothetical protein